jgi:nucleotide-binding universal stress UspA family protein
VASVSDPLLARPVVPVASEADARATSRALFPRIAGRDGRVLFVHVVEKAGGAPDKASVAQREAAAEEAFAAVREIASAYDVAVETRILYGTDVVEAIRDVAREVDATAVAFVPRGGSRILDVLTGDIRNRLLIESDRPVVALPDGSTGTGADGEEG